ncbi:MAG TPA: ATP-binding cassette domain-containing protein [Candidatus Binatia bacterium]|jgi:phospholipid/cholesterol/gamma-HCH transport system ATP-binding protein|nr:ATP-binding cassette domain-containing protein [Candidatus Binatia bacterium]HEU4637657.1 ATP-binding cassette domain-containing protein [Candidatus Binatia bacterium]
MIKVVNLQKSFGRQKVLKGVNLEFATGKITTIVGTSGCGKTVLLKHLNALLLPDEGEVLINGIDITKLGQKELYRIRAKFGVLFQGAALLDSMTVFDNVGFPLREKTRMNESEVKTKVADRLEQVGLGEMGHKLPAELSGGMRKRAGLARALIMDPEIVLFDEPTTGLDPVLATGIHQLISRTQNDFGYTGIIVSHTIPQVFDISDYIVMLAGGVVEEVAPPQAFSASENPIVQQFIHGRTEGPIEVL